MVNRITSSNIDIFTVGLIDMSKDMVRRNDSFVTPKSERVNPLYTNIRMHILLTVLYGFPFVPKRRIYWQSRYYLV